MLFRVDRAWLAGVPGGGDVRRKYVERYSSSKNCFGGSVCFKFCLYNRDCQIIEIQVIQDINTEIISAERLNTVVGCYNQVSHNIYQLFHVCKY